MMNKFQGPKDENFKLVSGTIKEMVREAKGLLLLNEKVRFLLRQ